jgi:ABC-type transport system involved in multi-copper enzyme maturation permease subunit
MSRFVIVIEKVLAIALWFIITIAFATLIVRIESKYAHLSEIQSQWD